MDVYDSYHPSHPTQPDWGTVGGTSLASPLIAGMIGLSGGAHTVSYPAASIYANTATNAANRYDVTVGGNAFCGGDPIPSCSGYVLGQTGNYQSNPNYLNNDPGTSSSLIDCSYPLTSAKPNVVARSRECNASTGYDGPSGVGTPNGLGLFSAYVPKGSFSATSVKTTATFAAAVTSPISVGVSSSTWNFGDGHGATVSGSKVSHTYAKGGRYLVAVRVVDANKQTASALYYSYVSVGYPPAIAVHGNTTVSHGRANSYNVTGSKSGNTGDHIAKVSWNWGDKHTSSGVTASHSWSKAGRYTLTVTITDSAGYSRSAARTITVK